MQDNYSINNEHIDFKPGDKPYFKLGQEILNNNIQWLDLLEEIIKKRRMTISQMAGRLHMSINMVKRVENGNNCCLNFKQGARLLTIYEVLIGDFK